MVRIRDGPGKGKAGSEAAFFDGKVRNVQGKQKRQLQKPEGRDRLQEVREHLFEMTVGTNVELSSETIAALYMQIDEMLQAPMLIWKKGVLYQNWAQCLRNETSSDDSRSGDTEVSLF